MDKTNKALWIDALRSGEYEQGKYYLCSKTKKYCCLGVLVKVFEEQNKLKFDSVLEDGCYTFGFCRTTPPQIVIDWIGLTKKQVGLLTSLNDHTTCNFNYIANILEEMK